MANALFLALLAECQKCGKTVFSTVEIPLCADCRKAAKKWKKPNIPEKLRWEVFERDNFTCKECGTRRRLTADHIWPEFLGGETTIDNLQTLCKSCNSRKGMKT